jgi:putative ATP-binding cassette transporter
MSLGQQQRVAFARVLLHKPKWVFMDEATSALDEDAQADMLSLFDEELAGASVLSIGHRPGLEAFHSRTIHIRKSEDGKVVLDRVGQRRPSQPSWLRHVKQRLGRRGS